MNARLDDVAPMAGAESANPADHIESAIDAVDWSNIGERLDAQGSAVIERFLKPEDC
jgi:hypothetical protein